MSTRVRKSYCTYPWCLNNYILSVTRMYTMMEKLCHPHHEYSGSLLKHQGIKYFETVQARYNVMTIS